MRILQYSQNSPGRTAFLPSYVARPSNIKACKRRSRSQMGRLLDEISRRERNMQFLERPAHPLSAISVQSLIYRRFSQRYDAFVHVRSRVRLPNRHCVQLFVVHGELKRTMFVGTNKIWDPHSVWAGSMTSITSIHSLSRFSNYLASAPVLFETDYLGQSLDVLGSIRCCFVLIAPEKAIPPLLKLGEDLDGLATISNIFVWPFISVGQFKFEYSTNSSTALCLPT